MTATSDAIRPSRTVGHVVVAALAIAALSAVTVTLLVAPPYTKLVVDDLGQLLAPTVAAVSCAVAARRSSGQVRQVWMAMALGCASWAVGQGIWTYYELLAGRETPFPSLADLGFLGFPLGAGSALWAYPAGAEAGDRRRRVLDGLTITAALGLVSWATALGAVASAGAENPLAFAIGLAYPATDLLILSMTLLVLTRTPENRPALLLIAVGVALIAVADSVFAYLTTLEIYGTGGLEGLGWMTGFTLLAIAPRAWSALARQPDPELLPAPTTSALPYLPVAVAAVVVVWLMVVGDPIDPVITWLGSLVLLLVLVRQYATLRDNGRLVTALADREAQLRHQAFHDGLTGLANRALFKDRVDHALALHRRDDRSLAVLFCDLDDFKIVNDTLGHAAGDALLTRVAERLRGALRAGDTLARLGGDEFAVLLEDAASPEVVAQTILEVLDEPFAIADRLVRIGASIGISTIGAGAGVPTASALLVQADTAMYAAKRDGRGLARSFQHGMALPEVVRHRQRDDLAEAISARDITLAFQPIVDLGSGRVRSLEALARWTHHGTEVSPTTFVEVAELHELIAPLTDLVLERACAQLTAMAAHEDQRELSVAVNVSPQQITDRRFPRHVAAILRSHGVSPTMLTIEITESGLLADIDAAEQVTGELAAMGIRIALDDFGVGYSSLAHLNRIQLHSIKIDRAFIAALGRDERQLRVTRALMTMGSELGLDVIAEGVEEPGQLALLRELGCTSAQGFLLGRPMGRDALHDLLAAGAIPAGVA